MSSASRVGKGEWALLIFLTLSIPFLYFKSRSVDYHRHADILQDIAQLSEQIAKLDEQIVKLRFGTEPSYDKISTITKDIRLQTTDLLEEILEGSDEALSEKWRGYTDLLKVKEDSVEAFKSSNAILRNSNNYLHLVVEDFIRANNYSGGSSELDKLADELVHVISQVNQTHEHRFIEDASRLLEQLKSRFDQTPNEAKEYLKGVVIHATTIVKQTDHVSGLMAKSFEIPVRDQLETILNLYLGNFHKIQSRASNFNLAMFVVASLLSILVILVLYRLTITTKQLNSSLSELNFQKFALDQHDIVSIADVKGNITYVNEKFTEISGYSREELIGQNHRMLKSEEHSIEFFRDMWRSIANGEVWHGAIRNQAKDGSSYWVESTIVPFLNEKGKPFQYVSMRTDITAQKALELNLERDVDERTFELQQAMILAEDASKAKSSFLAMMSHEIRTPMNSIMGMSRLALKTMLNSTQRNYIEKVLGSAENLLVIINDILDFSKIEAGKLDIEDTEFELEDVFDNVANIIGLRAQEKGIELTFDLPSDLPKIMTGDPLRLGQILLNLGNNAIKFTAQGEVVFTVRVQEQHKNSVNLLFTVLDTGVGISVENQNQLFKSFNQVDSSTSRTHGGTGLGLVISKKLTELMGGEIWVESEEGSGSSFHFTTYLTLPVEDNPKKEILLRESCGELNILLAESNRRSRSIIADILISQGLHVDSVDSLGGAISLLSESSSEATYDLMLFDSHLSDMSRMKEISALLRSKKLRSIPGVIMLAANGADYTVDADDDLKVLDLLSKPITPHSLIYSITLACGQEEPDVSQLMNSQSDEERAIVKLKGAHILLAEDNEINQELAVDLLTSSGMTVTVVNNGEEALQILQTETFDGVLMDCMMPVMDGYLATRHIRALPRFKNLPILAMTANAMNSDREKALSAGMNAHITKPINVTEMFNTMAQWIRNDNNQNSPD